MEISPVRPLKAHCLVVKTAASGFEALTLARDFEPDAMVLDIMMPDLDGMAVLQRLRQSGNDVPVLFLTAKDAVGDRVAYTLGSAGASSSAMRERRRSTLSSRLNARMSLSISWTGLAMLDHRAVEAIVASVLRQTCAPSTGKSGRFLQV